MFEIPFHSFVVIAAVLWICGWIGGFTTHWAWTKRKER